MDLIMDLSLFLLQLFLPFVGMLSLVTAGYAYFLHTFNKKKKKDASFLKLMTKVKRNHQINMEYNKLLNENEAVTCHVVNPQKSLEMFAGTTFRWEYCTPDLIAGTRKQKLKNRQRFIGEEWESFVMAVPPKERNFIYRRALEIKVFLYLNSKSQGDTDGDRQGDCDGDRR